MSRPNRSRITGTDGYRELEAIEEAARRTEKTYSSPIAERRKEKEKELIALKTEELKWRKTSPRSSKFLVPKGTGKRR